MRRFILAFAISIALHEVIAGLIPRELTQRVPNDEIVTGTRIVRIAQRPTPRPASRPTPAPPRPTPEPTLPAPRLQPRVAMSAPIAGRSGNTRIVQNNRPVWALASAHAIAAASLTGSGGSGTGSGSQGSGNGATSGEEPCGFVTFSDPHGSQYDPHRHGFWVDIRMSVHFAGGASQSMILDYPWYYPSETANPWSNQNLKDSNFPTRFQPPPSEKTSGEPPLVQYVAAHSTPDGMTLLHDCPTAPPPASRNR